MSSPFPGMNPYLEQASLWRDFHNTYLIFLRVALLPLVTPRYVVELEESLYLDPQDDDPRLFAVADTAISGTPLKQGKKRSAKPVVTASPGASSTVLSRGKKRSPVAAPVTVSIPRPARRQRRLVVRDSHSRTVVTVIELLSPSNKDSGVDRQSYERKRVEIVINGANLVELDFLRGGPRMPFNKLPDCAYYAMVGRVREWPRVGLWPIELCQPLPVIPVPLRASELEPTVDLQAVLHATYDGGGYANRIYEDAPEPPLLAADAAWAKQFVPQPVTDPT